MGDFQTFAEFLERRDADGRAADPSTITVGSEVTGPVEEPVTAGDPARPGVPGERVPVTERSISRGMFKAVNPARPVSPLNSRLLASPFRKRFRSQIMGR
jgi:hypothetical protein